MYLMKRIGQVVQLVNLGSNLFKRKSDRSEREEKEKLARLKRCAGKAGKN
jgi:hypothetical protein